MAVSEGIFGLNHRGKITFMNSAALQMLRYDRPGQVIGQESHRFMHHRNSNGEHLSSEQCSMRKAWSEGVAVYSDSEMFKRGDGEDITVEFSANPLFDDDKLVGAVVNFSDITMRKAQEERIWHQANFDQLTGVPNRSLFIDRLTTVLDQARRNNALLALLFIDLDRFKPINDQHGHDVGDVVLQTVARRIQASLRQSDTVARIGGDEFVAILPSVESSSDARIAVKKITASIKRPMEIDGQSISVGVSIGIALFPDDGECVETLLKQADHAMYKIKSTER
ncbi:hypothetical protein BOW53_15765 [Solemya pervernicosa gill symbiont]|uniref:GGDEF domain-containing protein n=1 Tax=Solemya pervernicosa gill symbiont TaxID=642797 RepID=A0A1T2KZY3_9GAMM|nr:sensor domain-containing diguanylate cyclase [Solemya pervernicosa gill symbiont]OOZ38382.1 hypothetical protein BOW53_15765 [Solemya pervernicosa gill symbiont]